ncbi:unnamed protein product [Aphis gossypii]|uniref:Uncharacterized protein n=1 Tax=Aphis gossypii TaxID=80765 RepID=A0A9P0NKN1_APHGO|nr:unnamed protein product [Aphis gossypii]
MHYYYALVHCDLVHNYHTAVHYQDAVWVLWFLYTFPTTLGHLVRSGRLCDPRVYCVILVFGLVFSFKFDCCIIAISSSSYNLMIVAFILNLVPHCLSTPIIGNLYFIHLLEYNTVIFIYYTINCKLLGSYTPLGVLMYT